MIASGVSSEDILFIDFESMEGQEIKTKNDLNKILKKKVPEGRPFYVFLDEIQNVEDWEMSISALNRMDNVDVYITGSSSKILSSDLATHISGRHVEIKIFPLSLKEYIELNHCPNGESALADYLNYGGLPAVDPIRGKRYATDYLRGVFDSVVVKDVLGHIGTANPAKVESISKFLFSNIGNVTNTSAIASATGFGTNTVDRYVNTMSDAFLVSECLRFDMIGKKLLKTNGKYYAMDLGLRNAILGLSAGTDISRPLENIVYIELLRRGYDVRVGSYRDAEIDFIASRSDSIEYFQVCQTMLSEETRKREIRSLKNAHDNYPKTILTLDKFGLGNENGIKIVNVIGWLLSEEKSN